MLRTLRCHPSVAGALQTYAVSDDFRPHSGPSITSVDILTTTEMAPGAWEMLDQHGEALGSGVLGQ